MLEELNPDKLYYTSVTFEGNGAGNIPPELINVDRDYHMYKTVKGALILNGWFSSFELIGMQDLTKKLYGIRVSFEIK